MTSRRKSSIKLSYHPDSLSLTLSFSKSVSKKTSTQVTNTSLVRPEEDDVLNETLLVAKRILITLILIYEKKLTLI